MADLAPLQNGMCPADTPSMLRFDDPLISDTPFLYPQATSQQLPPLRETTSFLLKNASRGHWGRSTIRHGTFGSMNRSGFRSEQRFFRLMMFDDGYMFGVRSVEVGP